MSVNSLNEYIVSEIKRYLEEDRKIKCLNAAYRTEIYNMKETIPLEVKCSCGCGTPILLSDDSNDFVKCGFENCKKVFSSSYVRCDCGEIHDCAYREILYCLCYRRHFCKTHANIYKLTYPCDDDNSFKCWIGCKNNQYYTSKNY